MRKWLALRFQCLFLLLNIKNYVCLLIWRTWQYICLDRIGKFSFVSKLDWKYTTKQVHLEPRQTCSAVVQWLSILHIFIEQRLSEGSALGVLEVSRSSHQRFSKEKAVFNLSQYSQENTFVGVNKVASCSKHKYFPVNVAWFLRTPIPKNIYEQPEVYSNIADGKK